MSKYFYSSIIEIESLTTELSKMDLSKEEKHNLAKLLDANLHNTILDTVLAELSDTEKGKFLEHLTEDNHEKIWEHLSKNVENIEDKIKKAAKDLKEEMHKDLKISSKLKIKK